MGHCVQLISVAHTLIRMHKLQSVRRRNLIQRCQVVQFASNLYSLQFWGHKYGKIQAIRPIRPVSSIRMLTSL
jgi:hypothetical protein